MIKYLIKTTTEIRVENEDAADTLHQEMQEEAGKIDAVLTSWTQTKREKKVKGEVVEVWYICKYTLTFNDSKQPIIPLENIDYNMVNNPIDRVMDTVPWGE